MSENYIVINGKKAELTNEQMELLGIKARKNPFERVSKNEQYYNISNRTRIMSYTEREDDTDQGLYNSVNYFNDLQFANQVALHQLLYRKLLKYSYDNECTDKEWDGTNVHFYIIYNSTKKDYDIRWTRDEKEPGTVYFKSTAWATAALNEVVMPFVKEHPDFVW